MKLLKRIKTTLLRKLIAGLAGGEAELVILESPYFVPGDEAATQENIKYAEACLHDSLTNHKEAPWASHLIYTRVLDDNFPEQRWLGINAGLAWGTVAARTVVYIDKGISAGMFKGIKHAIKKGRPIVFRSLEVGSELEALIMLRNMYDSELEEIGINLEKEIAKRRPVYNY